VASAPASYDRDLGKLEGSVGVLTTLTFTVIGFLVAIAGGGIFLLWQFYDVKSSLDETKRNVADALVRIGKIETATSGIKGAVSELQGGQVAASGAFSRIESYIVAALRGQNAPQLLISFDDAQTIRATLKFDPDQAYKGEGKLGDILADTKFFDFPSDLVSKFPQLKAMRYTFDAKGQILIASLPEKRVVAIV